MDVDRSARKMSVLGGPANGGASGSGNPFALDRELRVLDGPEVAGGSSDAETEEVAEAAYVAAGGVDLVEDAVLAHDLGAQSAVVLPGEGVAAGNEPGRGASVDEQVGDGWQRLHRPWLK